MLTNIKAIMNKWQYQPVIVNPELKTDPMHMQGKIGYIAAADLRNDDFFVDFENGRTGLYSASTLLVLRSHQVVYKALMSRQLPLDKVEFKDLMRVSTLLQSGGHQDDMREALRLIHSSPKLLLLATQSLREHIEESLATDREPFSGVER
jgi:hypothetical protein